ncbi:hypothetical protein BS47DRAFT_1360935 [Hydnum rufescens UP504]|uniref:Fungal lipase-type domain-containing protein n=1 Tax=Hydnum rufescens UP504 TaxID=1448309 RepID=A0A9P6B0M0_9AGAM|nr:hypothetical protein BS47DRAFT_1360935 [Hydnum rufescens UP504]
MFVTTTVSLLLTLLASLVLAFPGADLNETRSAITSVPPSTVTALTIYGQFSRASYCPPTQTSSWACGQACSALPGFVPYLVGGDDGPTPYYYVGYWPTKNTAVVVHQGRAPYYLESVLGDLGMTLSTLDSTLFPGLSCSIRVLFTVAFPKLLHSVHTGFAHVQALTATTILAAVDKILSDHSITKVTVIGHSLGAAVAMIDTVYLQLHLPSSTSLKFIGHGTPRVGNQAFADYVDATDPIPIVPDLSLGYRHVSGEVHILENDTWIACAGMYLNFIEHPP